MRFNLDENTLVYPAIDPTSTAITGQYSSAIDTLGYSGAFVIVHSGKHATNGTLRASVGEGTARTVTTTHTVISGATFVTITTSLDNTVYTGWLNLEKRARYISVRFVRATAASQCSSVVLLTRKQYAPSTQVNTVAFNI